MRLLMQVLVMSIATLNFNGLFFATPALAGEENPFIIQKKIFALAMNASSTSNAEVEALILPLGLKKSDVPAYFKGKRLQYHNYIASLKRVGIQMSKDGQIDLSQAKFSVKNLKEDPNLSIAIGIISSIDSMTKLLELDRQEALWMDEWVVLPSNAEGAPFKIFTKTKYADQVNRFRVEFLKAKNDFITASKKGHSYWNMMGIQLEWLRPWGKAKDIKNSEKIDRYDNEIQGALDRMDLILNYMDKKLGIKRDFYKFLVSVYQEALVLQKTFTEEGLAKLQKAEWAPAGALMVSTAMFTGGLSTWGALGTLARADAMNTAAVALTALTAIPVGVASYKAIVNDEDFIEQLSEATVSISAGPLYILGAVMMASTGAAAYGTGVAWLRPGTVALQHYGMANFGVTLYFLQRLARAGVAGAQGCYEGIQEISDTYRRPDQKIEADLFQKSVIQRCVYAGIDLSIALLIGVDTFKTGHTATQAAKAETGSLALKPSVKSFFNECATVSPMSWSSYFIDVVKRSVSAKATIATVPASSAFSRHE